MFRATGAAGELNWVSDGPLWYYVRAVVAVDTATLNSCSDYWCFFLRFAEVCIVYCCRSVRSPSSMCVRLGFQSAAVILR
jgi:hypothetical protein